MKYLIFFFLFFLGACSRTTSIANHSKAVETLVFHQYCLSDKFCTDSLLIRVLHSSDFQIKKFRSETSFVKIIINPIDVEKSSDQEIIEQFLLSLEAYNYYDSKVGQRLLYWTQYAFFDLLYLQRHQV